MTNTLDITYLGQVFTPSSIVRQMLALIKNQGRFLEPACGNGAFFKLLPQPKIGVELDSGVIRMQLCVMKIFLHCVPCISLTPL